MKFSIINPVEALSHIGVLYEDGANEINFFYENKKKET